MVNEFNRLTNFQSNMNSFFNPSSIAIVGISPSENRATLAYRNLIEIGFDGKIYFVNLKYGKVHGKTCYNTITDLPDNIDTVFVSVPGNLVVSILEEAYQKGAKSGVVISSGFGEGKKGDEDRKNKLVEFSEKNNFLICGPNCLGLFSVPNQFSAYGYFRPEKLSEGNVGGVFQSGGLMHAIAVELGQRGIGLSTFISSGNEAIVNSSDYLMYLAKDQYTKVILMFLEGINNPNKLIEAAQEAKKNNKVIIALKTGKSEKAQESAIAHTGSMAGNSEVITKIFEKNSIVEVNSIDELIESTILFSAYKNENYLFTSSDVAMCTISGGEVGMYSDLAEKYSINFPEFNATTAGEIEKVLPDFGTVSNPLDTTGNAALDKSVYKETLQSILKDENVSVCVISQMELSKESLETVKTSQVIVESLEEASEEERLQKNKKLLVCITPNVGSADDYISRRLIKKNIPLLLGAENSLKALRNLDRYLQMKGKSYNKGKKLETTANRDLLKGLSGTLSESESQKVFKVIGIKTPDKVIVNSSEEAVKAARKIEFPVVMKIDSKDIPHKTEIGGVKLNLNSVDAVEKAYDEILSSVREHHPKANVNGISVETMLKNGIEAFIGVKNDPMFGPIIGVGTGGILVELIKDFSFEIAPVTQEEAKMLIEKTKLSELLKGYRNQPPFDMNALANVISKLSSFVYKNKDLISEVDINPIIVMEEGKGCVAADGLVVLNNKIHNDVSMINPL